MNCEIIQVGPLYSLDPSQWQREAEEEVREMKSRKGLTPVTGFEDEERGPQAKTCRRPTEVGKARKRPPPRAYIQRGRQPCRGPILALGGLCQVSDFQTCERIHWYCLKH